MFTQEVETHKSINVKFTEAEFEFLQKHKRKGQSWKEYILSTPHRGPPSIDEKPSAYNNPLSKKYLTLNVEISHIKAHHAVALTHLFKHMHSAGVRGTSRYYAFHADGDGDFSPDFEIESSIELPEIEYDIGPEVKLLVHNISPNHIWQKVYGDSMEAVVEKFNDTIKSKLKRSGIVQ